MKRSVILWVEAILLITMLGSCASVPKESVELSREIGKSIFESQRSYDAMLNAYFDIKRQKVDELIEKEYLPRYLENIVMEQKKNDQPTTLSSEEATQVLRDVIEKRDKMISELEKTRKLFLAKSHEHYTLLIQGSNTLTVFLRSAVDVNEAIVSAAQITKEVSNSKIDWDKFDAMFNDYLKKAGALSTEAMDLYNQIKPITEKGE